MYDSCITKSLNVFIILVQRYVYRIYSIKPSRAYLIFVPFGVGLIWGRGLFET